MIKNILLNSFGREKFFLYFFKLCSFTSLSESHEIHFIADSLLLKKKISSNLFILILWVLNADSIKIELGNFNKKNL